MYFLGGQYTIVPKKKIGHNQKRTSLESLGILEFDWGYSSSAYDRRGRS